MVLKVSKHLFFLLALLHCSLLSAQVNLDKEKWENNKGDYEYETKERSEKKDIDFEPPSFDFQQFEDVIKLLVFTLVFAGLAYLIYRFIISNLHQSSSDESLIYYEDLDKVEDNLMTADLDKLLYKFLDAKDYKSAIRTLYLQILQSCSKNGNIKWAKQKTNFDYAQELSNAVFLDKFLSSTLIFEAAWYGLKDSNEKEFNRMKEYNQEIHKHLK